MLDSSVLPMWLRTTGNRSKQRCLPHRIRGGHFRQRGSCCCCCWCVGAAVLVALCLSQLTATPAFQSPRGVSARLPGACTAEAVSPRNRLLLFFGTLCFPLESCATTADSDDLVLAAKKRLLKLLLQRVDIKSSGAGGAPATSAGLAARDVAEISDLAQVLELSGHPGLAKDEAALKQLSGKWRLLYTDAPEITGLANLPLGLALGPVYQPIDTAFGTFENESPIVQSLDLVKGNLRVVGTFTAAPIGSLNAAGVKNEIGNRIDVNFERLVFSVDEIGGISTGSSLRKVASPQREVGAAQPAIDITYLDDSLRITRGGDSSLFVLVREDSTGPNTSERQRLTQETGEPVVQGKDAIKWISTLGTGA
eukprot:TRINITY_DN33805_c0_g2_i1.p1 TRINITY_DN33805_c0_g2~~TRINITY_DN33805_c0_g2_i1.p1  ORF type:complete len:366 (+),score=55.20 TRINITY_DN33805_c0_g2_i1:25-1122(+)